MRLGESWLVGQVQQNQAAIHHIQCTCVLRSRLLLPSNISIMFREISLRKAASVQFLRMCLASAAASQPLGTSDVRKQTNVSSVSAGEQSVHITICQVWRLLIFVNVLRDFADDIAKH